MPAALLSLSLSLSLTPKSFILETRGNRKNMAFSTFFHFSDSMAARHGTSERWKVIRHGLIQRGRFEVPSGAFHRFVKALAAYCFSIGTRL